MGLVSYKANIQIVLKRIFFKVFSKRSVPSQLRITFSFYWNGIYWKRTDCTFSHTFLISRMTNKIDSFLAVQSFVSFIILIKILTCFQESSFHNVKPDFMRYYHELLLNAKYSFKLRFKEAVDGKSTHFKISWL